MDPIARILVTLGGIFLASLAADALGRRTRLPRVTLLLILGVAVGPSALDLLPDLGEAWFPLVTDLALVMVAFLLGGALDRAVLREHGRAVLIVSVVVVIITAAVVALGLWALGWPLEVALLFGGVATATDPAAVRDVVHEARARGPFSRTLQGVVAVDDAWGLILLSVLLTAALWLQESAAPNGLLLHGLVDLGGAVLLGLGLGLPLALLTGRVRPGEPTLAEALGAVFLCGGLALWLDVSFLLAAMVMGVVVANLARHHTRPFRAIEGIEWPFLTLFFVLSGASLRVEELPHTGVLTAAFVMLRVLSRLLGGFLGTGLAGTSRPWRTWMGPALLPQAGVAVAMALVVARQVPERGELFLSVVLASTVIFELAGPIATRMSLVRVGEARLESAK